MMDQVAAAPADLTRRNRRRRCSAVAARLGWIAVGVELACILALRVYRNGGFGPWDTVVDGAMLVSVAIGLAVIVCGAWTWRERGWVAVLLGITATFVLPVVLVVNAMAKDVV
jgi:hypothetical protein